jgi:hypothetical protein
MTLKAIKPDELPTKTRSSNSKFTDAIVKQAIEMLRAGDAVEPDETFKNEGAARRFALGLRARIIETEPEVVKGQKVSTFVYQNEKKQHKSAILLREDKNGTAVEAA